MAGEAVAGAIGMRRGVANPALLLVEGEVVSDGIGVSRVAVDAAEAAGLKAAAPDKAERLEANIQRVTG
jgi:hypothetical protein